MAAYILLPRIYSIQAYRQTLIWRRIPGRSRIAVGMQKWTIPPRQVFASYQLPATCLAQRVGEEENKGRKFTTATLPPGKYLYPADTAGRDTSRERFEGGDSWAKQAGILPNSLLYAAIRFLNQMQYFVNCLTSQSEISLKHQMDQNVSQRHLQ